MVLEWGGWRDRLLSRGGVDTQKGISIYPCIYIRVLVTLKVITQIKSLTLNQILNILFINSAFITI